MKVLIVYSRNKGFIKSFINDQAQSLIVEKIDIDFYPIIGKGPWGYLTNYRNLINKIKEYNPDIIHAHYGFSGLLACLQNLVPVVVTYHGSDINLLIPRMFSRLSLRLADANIFVSEKLSHKVKIQNPIIIPCGINVNIFKPILKNEARITLGLELDKFYILFSSSFDNPIKNYKLASSIVDLLEKKYNVHLLELKGYKSEEVALLLSAVDVALMTSFSEGSPQFIKEAMACNTPIVSVDVGEVRKILCSACNCFISESYDAYELADLISQVFSSNARTDGRKYIDIYEESIIACKIIEIYKGILDKTKNIKNE